MINSSNYSVQRAQVYSSLLLHSHLLQKKTSRSLQMPFALYLALFDNYWLATKRTSGHPHRPLEPDFPREILWTAEYSFLHLREDYQWINLFSMHDVKNHNKRSTKVFRSVTSFGFFRKIQKRKCSKCQCVMAMNRLCTKKHIYKQFNLTGWLNPRQAKEHMFEEFLLGLKTLALFLF